jgi:hypothetical protein
MVAALLYSQVLCFFRSERARIRLSDEAGVERTLRVNVEEGRSSILGHLIGARGLSSRSSAALRFPPCR